MDQGEKHRRQEARGQITSVVCASWMKEGGREGGSGSGRASACVQVKVKGVMVYGVHVRARCICVDRERGRIEATYLWTVE